MTQRTRYFLVGSGLTVVVGLCTGLVAYYSGTLPGGSARGPAELMYVPADATAIAYADVRHIMDSEFHRRVQALLPAGQERDRFLAETGIDLEHDIDSVLAGIDGAGPAAGGHVALIRGRFSRDRVEALAIQRGATVEEYRTTRLVLAPPTAGAARATASPSNRTGFAFLEPTLLAFGDAAGIKRAVDAAATRDNVARNADLMEFVGGVAHNGDAWVVGRFDTLARSAALAPDMRAQFGGLQWFTLSADVDQSITCRLHAEARDPQSAEDVRSVVNGMLSAAKLMTNQDPRVGSVLNSVQASGAGSGIELTFTVPADMLDMVTDATHGVGAAPRAH